MQREQQRENESQINRDAAEQGNRLHVNFARAGSIHHAEAKREAPNRNRQAERRNECYGESNPSFGRNLIAQLLHHCVCTFAAYGYRAVSIFSRTPRTSSRCLAGEIPIHGFLQAFAERSLWLPAKKLLRELVVRDAIHGAGRHVWSESNLQFLACNHSSAPY